MRRSALAILFALALSACTQQHNMNAAEIQKHTNDEAWLSQQSGNAAAQLELGKYYCVNEPRGSGSPKTIAAWKKAIELNTAHPAPMNDTSIAAEAMENLGLLYLSLYEDPSGPFTHGSYNFDPEKDKPHAYCTGRVAGQTDVAAANKWLTACTDIKYENSFFRGVFECMSGLAHMNARQKNYAKAYYWYAMILAGGLQNEYYTQGKTMPPFSANDPLLHLKDHVYAEELYLKRMARHLSKAEIKKLDHAVTVAEQKRWAAWREGNESWERQKDAGRGD